MHIPTLLLVDQSSPEFFFRGTREESLSILDVSIRAGDIRD